MTKTRRLLSATKCKDKKPRVENTAVVYFCIVDINAICALPFLYRMLVLFPALVSLPSYMTNKHSLTCVLVACSAWTARANLGGSEQLCESDKRAVIKTWWFRGWMGCIGCLGDSAEDVA